MGKRVRVTASDIAKGTRASATGCPVARAMRRAGFRGAQAFLFGLYYRPPHHLRIVTPATVRDFLERFDHGDPVKPFTFYLPEGARS